MSGTVLSVSLSPKHCFSKQPRSAIHLLQGLGVEGDAHCGATVQHLYLKRKNPSAPNRMQVHLIPVEVLEDLQIQPGELGENITTHGIDLLSLPVGTRLHLGSSAIVELTGMRTPCSQIDVFRSGLQKQMIVRRTDGTRSARAGVMAVVVSGGDVAPGNGIRVELPAPPHSPLTMI